MPSARHRRRRPLPVRAVGVATALTAATATALVLPLSPVSSLASTASGELPAGTTRVTLPEPTGEHAVGRSTLHLVDEDREDVWVGGPRELMTTLWYPARSQEGPPAPYLTEAESAFIVEAQGLDLPSDVLHSGVGTHSLSEVQPAETEDGFPLVVLSPGAGHNRMWFSSLAEDLASRGFVVAAVDHAYEAAPVEFPDGIRVQEHSTDFRLGALNRAEDVSFLLDRLTGPDPAWSWSHVIDASRVGMAGHSWGGSATAETLRVEERVDAGINLDGPYYSPVAQEGVDEPLALIENGQGHTWEGVEEVWPHLRGWRQWIRMEGSGHSNGIDQGLVTDQLGGRDLYSPEEWRNLYGDIPLEQGLELVRAYSLAFFDHHLRDGDQPLLEDPESIHPELVVVEPEEG